MVIISYIAIGVVNTCIPLNELCLFIHNSAFDYTSRPIAGAINFCPSQLDVQSDQKMIDTGIHEALHALVCYTSVDRLHKVYSCC